MKNKVDSQVNLSGLDLESRVMIGAGPVKNKNDVKRLANSETSAIILGSITVEKREGNKGKTYFKARGGRFSLNSKGLPNEGLQLYAREMPEMVKIAHGNGKRFIVSDAGFSPDEYAAIAAEAAKAGADGIEINGSCPNVWGKNNDQKAIACFDPDLTGQILHGVNRAVGKGIWKSLKVSPYSNPADISRLAPIVAESGVDALVTTNTFPNACAFDKHGKPVIDVAGGLAGLGGRTMKEIGIGQVIQWRAELPERVKVIGVGGISTRYDAEDYLNADADAVQVTTAFINNGPNIFRRVSKGSLLDRLRRLLGFA